jgi:hypothetical protein
MKKDQFLELASQLFDQSTNLKEEEKIPIQKDLMDEIVDQIKSELYESGIGLIEDYELEMSCREVELESISFNLNEVEKIVEEVLKRYFSTFEA